MSLEEKPHWQKVKHMPQKGHDSKLQKRHSTKAVHNKKEKQKNIYICTRLYIQVITVY